MKKVNSKKWMKKLSVIGLSVTSVAGLSTSGLINHSSKQNIVSKNKVNNLSSHNANSILPDWKTDKIYNTKLLKNLTYKGQIIHNSYQPIAIQYVERGNITGFNVMYFTNGQLDTTKSMFYFAGPNNKVVADTKQNIVAACLTNESVKDGFAFLAKSRGQYEWIYVNWNSTKGRWSQEPDYNNGFAPSGSVTYFDEIKQNLDKGLCPVMTFFDSNETVNGHRAYQFNLNFNTGYNYVVSMLEEGPQGISDIYRSFSIVFKSFQNAKATDFKPIHSTPPAPSQFIRKSYLISTSTSQVFFENEYQDGPHEYRSYDPIVINNDGDPNTKLQTQNVFDFATRTGAYIDGAGNLYTYRILGNENPNLVRVKSNQDITQLGFSSKDQTYLNVTSAGDGDSYISLGDQTKKTIYNLFVTPTDPCENAGSDTSYLPEEMGNMRFSMTYKNVASNVMFNIDTKTSDLSIFYQKASIL